MIPSVVHEMLSRLRTVAEMVEAFRDEEEYRRLLEVMVWPNGRVCPAYGHRRSIALAGRDIGQYRARPSLYQCSDGACRFIPLAPEGALRKRSFAATHQGDGVAP